MAQGRGFLVLSGTEAWRVAGDRKSGAQAPFWEGSHINLFKPHPSRRFQVLKQENMKLRVCSEVHLDINHICHVLGPCSGNMITQCSEMGVASSLYFRDSSSKQGPARSSSAGPSPVLPQSKKWGAKVTVQLRILEGLTVGQLK